MDAADQRCVFPVATPDQPVVTARLRRRSELRLVRIGLFERRFPTTPLRNTKYSLFVDQRMRDPFFPAILRDHKNLDNERAN